jgi:hypothetical protein
MQGDAGEVSSFPDIPFFIRGFSVYKPGFEPGSEDMDIRRLNW